MKRPRATGIMAWAGASRCWGLLRAVLAIPLLAGPVGAQQTSVQAGANRGSTGCEGAADARSEEGEFAADDRAAQRPDACQHLWRDVGLDVHHRHLVCGVGRYRAIRANLPTAAVEQLAALEAVQSIRPDDVAVTPGRAQGLRSNIRSDVAATRAVDTSEGDVAHQANVARQTYSVDGTGIGIGVISDGVDTLAGQQETGDVPARVTVLPGQAGGSISYACGGSSKGTEGTAMLEIVHDLAPGGRRAVGGVLARHASESGGDRPRRSPILRQGEGT